MSTTQDLNSQIIQVLCLGTMQSGELLSALQSRFPGSGWTSSTLSSLLTLGTQQGRLKQVTYNPIRWQVARNMSDINPSNSVYQSFCKTIMPYYGCGR